MLYDAVCSLLRFDHEQVGNDESTRSSIHTRVVILTRITLFSYTPEIAAVQGCLVTPLNCDSMVV